MINLNKFTSIIFLTLLLSHSGSVFSAASAAGEAAAEKSVVTKIAVFIKENWSTSATEEDASSDGNK